MHTLDQQRIILPDSIILSNAFLIKKFPIFLPTEVNAILAFQCQSVIDFLVQELNLWVKSLRCSSEIIKDFIACKENICEFLSSNFHLQNNFWKYGVIGHFEASKLFSVCDKDYEKTLTSYPHAMFLQCKHIVNKTII